MPVFVHFVVIVVVGCKTPSYLPTYPLLKLLLSFEWYCFSDQIKVVLAVNGEAVEGVNKSNNCAFNLSQKLMFFSVLLCFMCILLPWYADFSNCPCVCGIRVIQKAYFHCMHLVLIMKFCSICSVF